MRPVVMVASVSGTRDLVEWPTPGQAILVPGDEADQLVNAGIARELNAGEEPIFPAAPAPVETAEEPAPAGTEAATEPEPAKGKSK